VTLTFDLLTQKHTTSSISEDHSLYQVRTLWDHSFLSYAAEKQTERQTNKQTDRQTDGLENPTHADRQVGVGN